MNERPEPEVYATTEGESVHWREEPITVRVYSSDRSATVVKLTPTEAGLLAARLLVTGAEICQAIDKKEGTL